MVRTSGQQGLIRARLAGANVASGDILVFLDSHCEASKGKKVGSFNSPNVRALKEIFF